MSTGTIMLIGGIAGLCATCLWILIDFASKGKRARKVVQAALRNSLANPGGAVTAPTYFKMLPTDEVGSGQVTAVLKDVLLDSATEKVADTEKMDATEEIRGGDSAEQTEALDEGVGTASLF